MPICPNGCKTIVDTGTYLIYGPASQLSRFLVDMKIEKCSEKSSLPNIGFVFNGFAKGGKSESFELILTPEEYILEFEVDGVTDCVVGLGSDTEDSGWTLGQVFLKAYYTVFDRDNQAVGFAKSNPYPSKIENINSQNEQNIPLRQQLGNIPSGGYQSFLNKDANQQDLNNQKLITQPHFNELASSTSLPDGPITNFEESFVTELNSFLR